MKRYKLYNNIFGWVAFIVAAITYLSTIEPTGSFWDCGEFASSTYKFDVGHPPGAPFFMLMGKFFTLFASDPWHIATMINRMSALCSAFAILFLFWTITHLARKIVIKNEQTDYTVSNIIAIIGSGLVGSLTYTFTDSYWFSAVESEVYALSAVFTAAVFWLILKWEEHADDEHSDRWLILIAYLTGLSVGVHLLNLLTIPALALVYYFKKYEPTARGVIVTVLASFAMVIVVLYGIVQGFVEVAAWFELLFVNGLGLPYNSGLLVYLILVIALLVWTIYLTRNPQKPALTNIIFLLTMSFIGAPFLMGSFWIGFFVIIVAVIFFIIFYKKINYQWLNTITVMATVLLIGYSSFGVIIIRSSAKPTMDQNAPNNVFSLKSYLNREQYGDRPLFYGEYFNALYDYESVGDGMYRVKTNDGANIYEKVAKSSDNQKDKYVVVGKKQETVFIDAYNTLFPRMYSRVPQHIDEYKSWSNMTTGKTINFEYGGQMRTDVIPTFADNLAYFFNYQLNYMYFRYFMWNFSGRQNDLAGNGEVDRGNWITGFNFIDKYRAGVNKEYPDELKNNKGHNVYYMMPFLLGVLGLVYQVFKNKKGKQGFWITFTLFFMTGIAIIIYLNQTPLQPRERDYAYAGSFYAYAIWIGIGVLGIISLLKKIKIPSLYGAIAASALCLVVPVQMATQNWDDHDRSGRYAMRDFGANYLNSCDANAIIFSNGDNDTFPLWYNQEVEGVRTDVRVCNLSYIQTDWYIDQMKRGAYKSAPLPISFDRKDYITGTNEYVQVQNILKEPIDVDLAYNFIKNPDKSTKLQDSSAYLPTDQIYISVNPDSVIAAGALPESRRDEIIPKITFNYSNKNGMSKGDMIVIDILNSNKWKRPVYFASTVGSSLYLGLDKNGQFVTTGMAYQVLPINTTKKPATSVDVEKTYDNLMTNFKYGNVADPKVYSDETVRRMVSSHRIVFLSLVDVLLANGDSVRAHNILDKHFEVFPPQTTGYDNLIFYLAADYYRTGDHQKANQYMDDFLKQNNQYLRWGFSLNRNQRESILRDLMNNFNVLQQAMQMFKTNNEKQMLDKYLPDYENYSLYFKEPSEHSEME